MMYGFLDPAAFDEDLAYRQERRPSFPSRLALGLIFVLSTLGKNIVPALARIVMAEVHADRLSLPNEEHDNRAKAKIVTRR
jgi:uncharacterized protein YjeT (DUF2065 family)